MNCNVELEINGQNVDEGEWHFLGSIEANDDLFEALDREPFAKK
ncbi:hypothetical protein LCGC14_2269820 [marine sediment metagenome]|uniref:Uncharacterized protein n=1 Tax=marine sediment metagenome TaxID=412755 RepID=A0A0F9F9P6_9ZZZZ